jgi:hypothetical protein
VRGCDLRVCIYIYIYIYIYISIYQISLFHRAFKFIIQGVRARGIQKYVLMF